MKTILAALFLFSSSLTAAEFELKDGDKVVWLGSTLIEREQRYGYWETALTARWPDRKITFRNLAWSGDNVHGEARLAFDINKPELGLKRMVDLTLAEKPTVIFICYGTNESFEGEAGLEKFEKGYEKLLDALAPAKARIVLMTPPPFEPPPPFVRRKELPDPTKLNAQMAGYCQAIHKLAKGRGLVLGDLNQHVASYYSVVDVYIPLTDNGMHFTRLGYAVTTAYVAMALGINKLRLAEDQEPFAALRQAIIEKNKLYFYRWRPQNETYLFGFRKHEQGKNAKEVAEYDPLIAKAEEEIDRLKKAATNK